MDNSKQTQETAYFSPGKIVEVYLREKAKLQDEFRSEESSAYLDELVDLKSFLDFKAKEAEGTFETWGKDSYILLVRLFEEKGVLEAAAKKALRTEGPAGESRTRKDFENFPEDRAKQLSTILYAGSTFERAPAPELTAYFDLARGMYGRVLEMIQKDVASEAEAFGKAPA